VVVDERQERGDGGVLEHGAAEVPHAGPRSARRSGRWRRSPKNRTRARGVVRSPVTSSGNMVTNAIPAWIDARRRGPPRPRPRLEREREVQHPVDERRVHRRHAVVAAFGVRGRDDAPAGRQPPRDQAAGLQQPHEAPQDAVVGAVEVVEQEHAGPGLPAAPRTAARSRCGPSRSTGRAVQIAHLLELAGRQRRERPPPGPRDVLDERGLAHAVGAPQADGWGGWLRLTGGEQPIEETTEAVGVEHGGRGCRSWAGHVPQGRSPDSLASAQRSGAPALASDQRHDSRTLTPGLSTRASASGGPAGPPERHDGQFLLSLDTPREWRRRNRRPWPLSTGATAAGMVVADPLRARTRPRPAPPRGNTPPQAMAPRGRGRVARTWWRCWSTTGC
jgi:hypothetical protein